MGALRAPPKEGQLFKQAFVKVGRLKELASRGCPPHPRKGKVQIREEVGVGAGELSNQIQALQWPWDIKSVFILHSRGPQNQEHTPLSLRQ